MSVVNSSMPNGTYALADRINVTVGFDEPVFVRPGQEPSLSIALDGGASRSAPYASGNGTALLEFAYTVQYGDTSDDLDYGSMAALTGGVWDGAGNAANLTLPRPGGAGSLSRPADILVDYAAPRLVAADSVQNGDPGFRALSNSLYVDAFHVGNRTYAVASSEWPGVGIQLARVHENGTLSPAGYASAASDSPSTLPLRDRYLFGAKGITVGGNPYLVVTAFSDQAVSLIRYGENGSLSVADVLHSSSLKLNGAAGIDTFEMDGGTYALVAAFQEHAVQLIQIHGNGTMEAGGSLGTLSGPNAVDVFDLNGETHALVSAWNAGAVQLIRVHGNGTMEARGSLYDGGDIRLGRAYGVAAFDLDGLTHALVGSEYDDAVQLIRVHENGTLEAVDAAVDGSGGFDRLNNAHHVTTFSSGSGTYALAAAHDDDAVQMIRVRGGDAALLPAGSAADGEDGFERIVNPYRADVFALGGGTYAISHEDVAPVAGLQLMRLSPAPFPASVTSKAADGVHGTGSEVYIDVQFDDDVRVAGPLDIRLNSGGAAEYFSGNNTDTLVFRYTVQQGERAADLEYAAGASVSGSGTIVDAGTGFPADRTLPPPGSGRSLGDLKDIAVDGSGARQIASAGSPAANGTYRLGDALNITVAFDAPVRVAGEIGLPLNSGGAAEYVSGSGTAELVFRYTVRHGEQAADLEYAAGANAVSGSGTIVSASGGVPANRVLPLPGTGRSLGDLKDIAVDARAPSVASVASADGAYGPGGRFDVAVKFDEPVAYSGPAPVLHLNVSGASRPAAYASGNGTGTLSFAYEVQVGDRADDLDYYGAGALAGGIADLAGNPVALALPPPGSTGSLAGSHDVLLDSALLQLAAAGWAADSGGSFNALGSFDALGFSVDADALAINGTTYVVVAALEDAVQLIRVHANGTMEADGEARDSTSVTASDFDALNGAYGVDAFFMGERAYAIVASSEDNGVQLIRIHDNGTLKAVDDLVDDGPGGDLELAGAVRVAAFDMNGAMHALVSARNDDGVQLVRIHDNGTLEARGSLGDDGALELDEAYGVAMFDLGGSPHALVSGHEDDGVQLVRVRDDGTLEAGGSLGDGSGLELDGPRDVAALDLGGDAYAVVASRWDNGVQLIRVHDNGTLSPAGLAAENAGGFDELYGAYGVDAFTMGGDAYAVVASRWDDGVQLIRVRAGDGALFAAGSAANGDGDFDALRGAFAVDAFDVDGRAYAIVASAEGSGVQLFGLSPPTAAVNATSPAADGTYRLGDALNITVAFDAPVRVAGEIGLLLNSGGSAEYLSGNGSAELVFRYEVQRGDAAADLDYAGPYALYGTGGASVADADTGARARTVLPPPGAAGSLGGARSIAVDGVAPRVASVSSPAAAAGGAHPAGSEIRIDVEFSEAVAHPGGQGAPELSLDVGGVTRTAPYASGNDTGTLSFRYTVQAGDLADRLAYAGTGALAGGALADLAGNPANLTLPAPGSPGSLSGSGAVALDGVAPRVAGVNSSAPDGAYRPNQRITVSVNFDEAVRIPGGSAEPSLLLNVSGIPRAAEYRSGSGTPSISFDYLVLAGDAAGDLGYYNATSLSGPLADLAGNPADRTLPAPGSPGSLSGSSAIRVDGTLPAFVTAEAVFTGPNTVRIDYSSPLGPPGGRAGPAYGAVSIDGADEEAPAVSESGLGTRTHTVRFGGSGVSDEQAGSIRLLAALSGGEEGAVAYEFPAGTIPVAAGEGARTLSPPGAAAPVASIETDGFVRAVDATAAGDAARPGINVTGLPDAAGSPAQGPRAVTMPGGNVTLIASFAEVTFPPNVEVEPVPADGLLELYVSPRPPTAQEVADGFMVPVAGVEVLSVVEVGDSAARIAFDMPVRILLRGMAGASAFYVNGTGGAVVPIASACAGDDFSAVHANLSGAGECHLDLGDDKAVYTYHLTQFGAANVPDGAGPGAGGSGAAETCSAGLAPPGAIDFGSAGPGGRSGPEGKAVNMTGTLPLAGVTIEATGWTRADGGGLAMPPGATEVRTGGAGGAWTPLDGGVDAVIGEGGLSAYVEFRVAIPPGALGGSAGAVQATQAVTYTVSCVDAPG